MNLIVSYFEQAIIELCTLLIENPSITTIDERIAAPPSIKPRKKYCDVTGLEVHDLCISIRLQLTNNIN
jgi:hypothetical protein